MKKKIEERTEERRGRSKLWWLSRLLLVAAALTNVFVAIHHIRKAEEFRRAIESAHIYRPSKSEVRVCSGPKDAEVCTPWEEAKDAR